MVVLATVLLTAAESKDEVQGGLFLNVVIAERSAILKLLSSKNQSLLIGRDAFLVLDLLLYILDRVAWLDIKGNGLSGQGLYEYLHLS